MAKKNGRVDSPLAGMKFFRPTENPDIVLSTVNANTPAYTGNDREAYLQQLKQVGVTPITMSLSAYPSLQSSSDFVLRSMISQIGVTVYAVSGKQAINKLVAAGATIIDCTELEATQSGTNSPTRPNSSRNPQR